MRQFFAIVTSWKLRRHVAGDPRRRHTRPFYDNPTLWAIEMVLAANRAGKLVSKSLVVGGFERVL